MPPKSLVQIWPHALTHASHSDRDRVTDRATARDRPSDIKSPKERIRFTLAIFHILCQQQPARWGECLLVFVTLRPIRQQGKAVRGVRDEQERLIIKPIRVIAFPPPIGEPFTWKEREITQSAIPNGAGKHASSILLAHSLAPSQFN